MLLVLAIFAAAVHIVPELARRTLPFDGYPRAAVINSAQMILVLLAVAAAHRTGLRGVGSELALGPTIGRGLGVAFVSAAPMLLLFAAVGGLRTGWDLWQLVVTGLTAPLAEELVFRGYAFGQLERRAGWGFWPAVLLPTGVFALGHLQQADGLAAAAGIFAVTAIGGIWFSWLYLRWENLWVAIALHSFMNLWWYVFDVDSTALGGWTANGARLIVVALSIVLTLRLRPKAPA